METLQLLHGVGNLTLGGDLVLLCLGKQSLLGAHLLGQVVDALVGVGHHGLITLLSFHLGLLGVGHQVLGIIDELLNHGHDAACTGVWLVLGLCHWRSLLMVCLDLN